MPTYSITAPDGKTYSIDGPEGATREQIIGKIQERIGQPQQQSDPIHQQVAGEIAVGRARGDPVDAPFGLGRRFAQGATLGAADEIMAGLQTPLEMIARHTLNPVEGYKYAKARDDILMENARRNQGIAGNAMELGGGVFTGGGAAKAGLTLLPKEAGLLTRSAALGGEGAAYGGVSGFNDGGNSLDERLGGAAKGAAIGGATGAALPIAGAIAGPVVGPVVSSMRARFNPAGVAQSQLARALQESGKSAADVTADVANAHASGQGVYTLADALGNPGQRLLGTVTRAPGEGRTMATDFLDARQAGQGRRLANALSEGLEAPDTAAQRTTSLEASRSATAARNYGQARADAGAVDVSPAIALTDQHLTPGVTRVASPQSGIADNSIEATVRRARGFLTDGKSQVSDFNSALQAKKEIDNLIETGSKSQQQALIPIRNALDDQLANSSQSYANARNTFRRQSQAIEAVQSGSDAAARGRMQDTIPAFRRMQPNQQSGYRAGYADRLIGQIESAAPGVNKARGLTADDIQAELQAVSPMRLGNPMMQRIARENRMFETRAQATGGSKTADNLADMNEMRIDPSVAGAIAMGHYGAAAGNLFKNAVTNLSGYTPAVRAELAKLLLSRGGNQNLSPMLQKMSDQTAKRALISRALVSGGLAGEGRLLPAQ